MPRTARQKCPTDIHHIMIHSIDEVDLFRSNDDKMIFLKHLKKYTDYFQCLVLGYCLMSNHAHIHFDPQGGDISKVMHCVNQSYAIYYNHKYNRRGPLFLGRYVNKVVFTDNYNLALSAYIHNNPKDLPGYTDQVDKYPFSSLGIYLGTQKNHFDLVNPSFILAYFGGAKDLNQARKRYKDFVFAMNGTKQTEASYKDAFKDVYSDIICQSFQSERILFTRNLSPQSICEHLQSYMSSTLNICDKLDITSICNNIAHPSNDLANDIRALVAMLLRSLGNYTYKQLSIALGNVSENIATKLHAQGCYLLILNPNYNPILNHYRYNISGIIQP